MASKLKQASARGLTPEPALIYNHPQTNPPVVPRIHPLPTTKGHGGTKQPFVVYPKVRKYLSYILLSVSKSTRNLGST